MAQSSSDLKDKLTSPDQQTLETKSKEFKEWLENHPEESKDIYEEKYKELEQIAFPIMTKAYQQSSGQGQQTQGGFPGSNTPTTNPTVEEVD